MLFYKLIVRKLKLRALKVVQWQRIQWRRHKRSGFDPWVEDPLVEMATCSSILLCKVPWSEEPGRLQSMVQSWIWLGTAAAAALFLMVCFFSFFFFWLHGMAFAILVSWPGIEPRPRAVKASSPNHWAAREFPLLAFCKCFYTWK